MSSPLKKKKSCTQLCLYFLGQMNDADMFKFLFFFCFFIKEVSGLVTLLCFDCIQMNLLYRCYDCNMACVCV